MRRFEQLAPTFRSAYESFPFSWVYLTAADEATDPALAAEIDQVNAEAGAAVLYFRTPDGIKHLGAKDAVASQSAEVGSAVERLLSRAERTRDASVRLDVDGRRLLAARIERTGWLLVLMAPRTPST